MLIAHPERNKSVVRRLTRELFNDGGDADAARMLLADDFIDCTSPPSPDTSRQAYIRRALDLRAQVTALRTETEQLVAEDDVVFERYRRTFRQAGGRIEEVGFAQYRVRHGRVIEVWGQSQTALVPRGTDELTPRELRVALLVAEGWSNPEVADELALSRKTVEAHLSAIYRKLGLRSRIELARALAPHLALLAPDGDGGARSALSAA